MRVSYGLQLSFYLAKSLHMASLYCQQAQPSQRIFPTEGLQQPPWPSRSLISKSQIPLR